MLSLVIPVYRNEENLPRLLMELETFASSFGDPLEVVFVVDGSPDASLRILQERLPRWPVRSQLVELSRNFGSFAAIAAGMRAARGEYMAALSADLQEPLSLVREFHRLMAAGDADVVFGHRTGRADARSSSVMSDLFWRLYRRFVVPDMPKGGVDMFGCTRAVRDVFTGMKEVNTNLIALLLWLGFRRAFVPYERQARLEGKSAWTFSRKMRYAIDSVFAFTDLPIRALLVMGTVGTALAIVAGVTVFIGWATGHVPVLGYTPLMLVITFFGGLTALGLGITGQYLWLTLQNSRGRPPFVVRAADAYDGGGQPRADTSRKNSS
jgi:glycosyltransferase involved in cell wall biosynthesis